MTMPRPDAARYASRSASNELLDVMFITAKELLRNTGPPPDRNAIQDTKADND